MTLNDRETLELNELCNCASRRNSRRLAARRSRAGSPNRRTRRRYFVQAMDLSGSLCHYAGEMQMEAADAPARGTPLGTLPKWMWATIAASLAIAGGFWAVSLSPPQTPGVVDPTIPRPVEYVARLTGEKNCRWSDVSVDRQSGDYFAAVNS